MKASRFALSRRTIIRASTILLLVPILVFLRSSANDAAPGRLGTLNERARAAGQGRGWRGLGLGPGGGGGTGAGKERREGRGGETWVDLREDMPWTTYEGGLPGYTVFSNLYLSRGALLAVTPSASPATSSDDDDDALAGEGAARRAPIPPARAVMSGEKRAGGGWPAPGEDRWREVEGGDVTRDELGDVAVRLPGVTYIFNDVPGPEGYLVYFKHFGIEIFLGATRALASALAGRDTTLEVAPAPQRVWFPRCGSRPGWRDGAGLNAWFLAHALPEATVEDVNGWEDREGADVPYVLETVVIVDRWSAHSVGGEVGKWGKMNANIPTLPAPPLFWERIRTNVIRSLGVHGPSHVGRHGLPVVVFIDQDRITPKLSKTARDSLVDALKEFTDRAEVHVTNLASMERNQQVEITSRAHVLIGTHSDLLLNALWMQAAPGVTLVEIFQDGAFARDHELLASSLGLKYVALHPDKVLDEASWRALGRKENKEPEIELDAGVVVGVLAEVLEGIPWP
ncbi:hypothetical protein Q5752_005893 [Cryptotrichosporon argae]